MHLLVPAHAKVNLALEVTGRRADGYHDLASVVVAIDWHDLVEVTVAATEDGDRRRSASEPAPGNSGRRGAGERDEPIRVRVRVDGPTATAEMAAAEGLVARAAMAALRTGTGGRPTRPGRDQSEPRPTAAAVIDVHVYKRLPVAAGLGGGSADAAAVLAAVGGLVGADQASLAEAAAGLGSDVPAVLAGGALLVGGRGEALRRLRPPALDLVVAVAGASSTASAYGALLRAEHSDGGRARRLADALDDGLPPDDADLGSALEASARRAAPELGRAIDAVRALEPALRWHLTGSGGALFAILPGRRTAHAAAARLLAAGVVARACRTLAATPPTTAHAAPRSPSPPPTIAP